MTTLYPGMIVPKYYIPGLGYSPSSGPPIGGYGVGANPRQYSSTFYGSDVKQLYPNTWQFSKNAKKVTKRAKLVNVINVVVNKLQNIKSQYVYNKIIKCPKKKLNSKLTNTKIN